jgi:DNA-directed RNA polymerase subunit RPC12/RpoP
MECPECGFKAKFPISVIGTTVQCPNCRSKVDIDGINENLESD